MLAAAIWRFGYGRFEDSSPDRALSKVNDTDASNDCFRPQAELHKRELHSNMLKTVESPLPRIRDASFQSLAVLKRKP